MKIGFVVNDVATEHAGYTTTRLALSAHQMGHEAGLIGLGDFNYLPDGALGALVHAPSGKNYRSYDRYLADVQKNGGEQTVLSDFDVLMLRSDPASDPERPWASTAGVAFGQLAAASGVLVVNDPETLATAVSKAYFQHFPERVRPQTLISRDAEQINSFVNDLGGRAVLKPQQGSGCSGVFLVNDEESPNLNQIIEAIARDGYVVAQEYLPAAAAGDTRLLVMNGHPLKVDGAYAAFRRVNDSKDMRSNVSAGGRIREASITDEMLEMVDVRQGGLPAAVAGLPVHLREGGGADRAGAVVHLHRQAGHLRLRRRPAPDPQARLDQLSRRSDVPAVPDQPGRRAERCRARDVHAGPGGRRPHQHGVDRLLGGAHGGAGHRHPLLQPLRHRGEGVHRAGGAGHRRRGCDGRRHPVHPLLLERGRPGRRHAVQDRRRHDGHRAEHVRPDRHRCWSSPRSPSTRRSWPMSPR